MSETRIGKYLTLEQACKSNTALKFGITNTASKEEQKRIKYLYTEVYSPLCHHFGARLNFTNWFRSRAVNAKIKGASKTSFHLRGSAVDIDMDGTSVNNIDIFNFILENLPFTELILEYPDQNGSPSWVHVAVEEGRENEKVVKKVTKQGTEIISRG